MLYRGFPFQETEGKRRGGATILSGSLSDNSREANDVIRFKLKAHLGGWD